MSQIWLTSTSTSSPMAVKFVGGMRIDARLIHASVTTPSVVGYHCKLPSSVIILINGRLFSPGSRVLHLDTKPCSFGTTQTITSL